MKQLEDWSVCQVCGRISPRGTDDWLDSQWKANPEYRIVRCPKHWSEWALRNCVAGRTNANRTKLYALRKKYGYWSDDAPFQPIPTHDGPPR